MSEFLANASFKKKKKKEQQLYEIGPEVRFTYWDLVLIKGIRCTHTQTRYAIRLKKQFSVALRKIVYVWHHFQQTVILYTAI